MSQHASKASANRALAAHLQANGGHGHAVITKPGNKFGAKPVPVTIGKSVQ